MKDDMRVVIDACCLGRKKTGNETYLRGLLEGLSDSTVPGLDLTVLTTQYYKGARSDTFEWLDIPLSNFFTRNFLTIPSRLDRIRPALYHGVYWSRYWDAQPKILTVHDISFVTRPEGYRAHERFVYRNLIRRATERARHILTVSEYSKNEIIEHWKIPAERITVTHLAVAQHFKPSSNGGRPDAEPYILYVGNLHPRKNLVRLLKALVQLNRDSTMTARLKIVGQKAWLYNDIFATLRHHGLEKCVDFTGYVTDEELVRLYQSATVTVYPSVYEGFGLPVLEAMACGSPVIASGTTSIPEVAGNAGILIDPTSVEEIATAIRRVLSDPTLQSSMRSAGIAQAAKFSWERMARETAAAYRIAAG